MKRLLIVLPLLSACAVQEEPAPTRYTADQVAQVDVICPGDPSGACDFA